MTLLGLLSLALLPAACAGKSAEPSATRGPTGADSGSSSGAASAGGSSQPGNGSGTGLPTSGDVATGAGSGNGATGGASTSGAPEFASGASAGAKNTSSGAATGSGATDASGASDDSGVTVYPSPACPEAGANHPRGDGGLSGCAAQVPTSIFGASCEGGVCHNSRAKEYLLDLQSPGVASRLINVPSLEIPCFKLIDPENPDESYILLKVQPNPPAGAEMPSGGAMLSSAQIQCLREWVEAEAATAE
jgi:hypothetical protein